MPIELICQCGKRLRARDDQAGRECRCPACGSVLHVPYPKAALAAPPPPTGGGHTREEVAAAHLRSAMATASGKVDPSAAQANIPVATAIAHPSTWKALGGLPADAEKPPFTPIPEHLEKRDRSWRGHVFWLLVLFAIPIIALTITGKPNFEDLLNKTLARSPQLNEQFERDSPHGQLRALDELLDKLPGHRIHGALLARNSWAHWLFALAACGIFFPLVCFAIPSETTSPTELLASGAFTATVGVMTLLTLQYFGLFCCCIGVWYVAALDPRAPFGPSLLGFVLGVGTCEEIVKCIPVLWLIHRRRLGWREACLVGMASGAGFGISEGIHYSTHFYNGIAGFDIYLVRFISTIALHVMLSGACGIMIWRKQKFLADWKIVTDWIITMMAILLGPIVLHGLFDALLKKGYDPAAAGVWMASFAFLAAQIYSAREGERKAARNLVAGPKLIYTEKGTIFVKS